MADNSAALRRARRQDGAAKRRHAAETIEALERSGEPISFPAIARRAGVSVSLLYSDSELANSKEQARQLTEEVGLLRERLARQLGADADLARGHAIRPMLDQLEDRAAELEADNHALRQRVSRLEGDLTDLSDTLDAARSMNRELMTQLNHGAADPGGASTSNKPTQRA